MPITSEELVTAAHRVADGDATVSPRLAVFVLESFRGTDSLTDLEQEVMLLIASGYSHREIAARLGLSVEAIETHAAGALRRLA